MRGQLSAEMLIVLVVILGLAVILAGVMLKSAANAGSAVENQTNTLIEAGKGLPGAFCTENSGCRSDSCDTSSDTCD